MTLPRQLLALLLLVCVQLASALPSSAQTTTGPTFPQLTGRVVDGANILSQDVRDSLTQKLQALQDKTSTQLVVVTLPSLQGYEIEDYGYQLGRAWGIGQKNLNNGALLIVAPNERKVRIEVGYGLEPTITDAVSRLIIENAILPRFRAGDFPGGIERGVDDLIKVMSGDEEFKKRADEQQRQAREQTGHFDWVTFLVIAFFLFIFLRRFFGGGGGGSSFGNRRGGFVPPIFFPGGGGRGGGFGGGGGFSGGGGSFGGGGASGSW